MSKRNVAVAFDYSPSSKYALSWTLANAVRDGDHLMIVIVNKLENESGVSNLWENSGSPIIPFNDFKLANVEKSYGLQPLPDVYAEVDEAITQKRLIVAAKVYFGDAREKIVHFVVERSIDHLVMGNRGLGGFKRMLMGSVSNYVVNNAPCPVTVVKLPDPGM